MRRRGTVITVISARRSHPTRSEQTIRAPVEWSLVLTAVFLISLTQPDLTFFSRPTDYTILHLVLEFVSMAVSFMVFALAWNLRLRQSNSQIIVLGVTSLVIVLLDLAHTLSYAGMPDFITPSGPEKAIYFWLVSRLVAAVGFLVVALTPVRHWPRQVWPIALTLALAFVVLVLWTGLAHFDVLPRTFIAGKGLTSFKVRSEYVLATMYVAAAVLLLRRARRLKSIEVAWLACASWTLALTELFFTLYASVTDMFNLLGHVFKVIAYLMVYRAVFMAGVQDPHRRLQREKSRLRSLIDSVPDLISFKDRDDVYLGANKAFGAFTGVPEEDLVGSTAAAFMNVTTTETSQTAASDTTPADSAGLGNTRRFEEWLTGKEGQITAFDTLATPYFGPDGELLGTIEVRRDVTRQKHDAAQIEDLAHMDQLTGLPNRILLAESVRALTSSSAVREEGLALLYLDLDDFKTINDTIGHRVGDLVLQETGRRLQEAIGAGDVVARLGGDEFALALPGMTAQGASDFALNLLARLGKPILIDQHELIVTTSIGISMFPDNADEFEELARDADAAMSRAKAQGRNSLRFFSADMQEESVLRLALLAALHRAVENDELLLEYQPQVSLADGSVVGVEALIRWQHPQLGLMPPSAFIGLAEDSGLIHEIGDWVIQQAIGDAQRWDAEGANPVVVAVNISAVQFRQLGLPQRIARILEATHFPPERLEVELTESVAMSAPDIAEDMIGRLHGLGVQVSLDDFGTGYSSLAYLTRFRVNQLKIDRTFVHDLATDPDEIAIVTAIIQVARALNCATVAEGVETQVQQEILTSLGCDLLQGYLFSRPVPPTEIPELLRRHPTARS
ncbi:MAG: EAL domain-containing protein [Actinomycetes bacterium]